jgi:hypothetical protein
MPRSASPSLNRYKSELNQTTSTGMSAGRRARARARAESSKYATPSCPQPPRIARFFLNCFCRWRASRPTSPSLRDGGERPGPRRERPGLSVAPSCAHDIIAPRARLRAQHAQCTSRRDIALHCSFINGHLIYLCVPPRLLLVPEQMPSSKSRDESCLVRSLFLTRSNASFITWYSILSCWLTPSPLSLSVHQ